jgi:TRAP-type C4-dicarboxylate transport system permease large subunit
MGFLMAGICTPSVRGARRRRRNCRRLALQDPQLEDDLELVRRVHEDCGTEQVIIASATMFSQLVAYTGASAKLATWVATPSAPLLMLFMMMAFPFVWCMLPRPGGTHYYHPHLPAVVEIDGIRSGVVRTLIF